MFLSASNRKAPSRAAIAATLSALTALGATSVAVADTAPQQGYSQPGYGYGVQGQLPPGYGYGQQQAPFAGYAGVAAPQGYTQPVAPQGFANPYQQQVASAPVAPGYGAPRPFPGYGVPGGYPVPASSAGFDPYGGMPDYGLSSQWANFAPSEPNYAPHERAKPTAAVVPAPVQVEVAPAAPAPVQAATVATTSPDYSYEVAPASSATYVGNSAQFSAGSDPYQAVLEQQATTQQQSGYQVVEPNYTQQYDAAGSYAAPAPAPAPNYTVAAPAAPQAPVNVGGYEYQTVPQQPAADYYDLSAQSAAAAVAAPSVAPAPAYEVSSYAAPTGTHFVQVGAFIDPNRANKLLNQLGSAGVQAFIVPAQVRGKLYHRVRIGANSKRDAQLVLDQVRGLNYYEARIVRG